VFSHRSNPNNHKMSGYPQQPGYNPEYGYQTGQGYQQPNYGGAGGAYQQPAYPPQQGYTPQPGYPPQYPATGYGVPSSQPVTVNVVNTQNQTSAAPVVFLGRNYDSDIAPALIIFIIGWFCCFVWVAGFRFIRSPNGVARALGIVSVVLFFSSLIAIVVSISVSVAAVNNVANNNPSSSSTTVYGSGSSSSIYVPSGTNYVSIYTSGCWTGQGMTYCTSSSGYSGTSCYLKGTGCGLQYSNFMLLLAQCGGTYGSWTSASSGTSIYTCSSSYLYFTANQPSSYGGGGSLFVTATFY